MCQPGTTVAPGRRPRGLARLRRLPQHEVERIALGAIDFDARAGAQVLELLAGQLSVRRELVHVVHHVAVRRLVGVAALDQLADHRQHLVDVLGSLGLLLRPQAAERVEILVHGRGEFPRVLAPVDARLARAVDDLVVDVGDVAHVGHAQPAMPQIAAHHVEHHQHAGIADVEIVVDGDAAAVHAHVAGLDGLQFLLLARQGIVDADHAAKRFSRSWMAGSGMALSSGASSGPSGAPVSARRSGFHSAWPLAPVAAFTASTMASRLPPWRGRLGGRAEELRTRLAHARQRGLVERRATARRPPRASARHRRAAAHWDGSRR